MKFKFIVMAVVAVVLSGCAARVNLIAFRTPYEQFFVATTTTSEIHDAVIQSAQELSWKVNFDSIGNMELTYAGAGRHELTVKLSYSNTYLAVEYVSSKNMKEKVGCLDMSAPGTKQDFSGLCLHKNAQTWVRELLNSISRKVNNGEI